MKRLILTVPAILAMMILCSSRPLRFACIGDSVTYGHAIEDRERDSYPSVLQRMLGDEYEVRNYGFSARVMQNDGDYPYMKEDMYSEVKAWLPDIITIMLGSNDSKYQNWKDADRFKADYLTMVDELRALPSHPQIYLCLPPKPSVDRWGINDSTIYNGVIPVIKHFRGRRWLDIIDTYTPFDGHPELYSADGVHPNAAGAAVIAETIYSGLEECGMTGHPGKRILFIGDSITDGDWAKADGKQSEDRNSYDMNHLYGHGYMSMCATAMMSKYPERKYTFFNRGISGNNLRQLEERWDKDVIALHPDVVSVLIGVNDLNSDTVKNFDFDNWEKRYRGVLDRTLESDPSVRFVLCTPFMEKVGAIGHNEDYDSLKAAVAKLTLTVHRIASDYNAVLVPFDEEMDRLVATDKSGNIHYWTWDGIHPTYQAHEHLSRLWLKKARKLL